LRQGDKGRGTLRTKIKKAYDYWKELNLWNKLEQGKVDDLAEFRHRERKKPRN
jgi:hypothetical protein